MDDAILALYQNGERLRPEQGYPVRLFLPGYEGNMSVKWLRRIKVTAEPTMTKDETSKYSDLQPNGRSLLFTFPMEVKSVITSPSGMQKMQGPGLYQVSGMAWSGFGRIRRVEVSADGGKSLGASRARRSRAADGGHALPHAVALGRQPERAAEPRHRRDGRRAAVASRADGGARRAVSLPLQRDSELERRGGRRGEQRLCVSSRSRSRLGSAWLACATAQEGPGLGVPATPEQVAGWDISIGPDGAGLPPGSGTAAAGKTVYEAKCLACHGVDGAGRPNDQLVGGQGTLREAAPIRTVGSYWPYATTVFDYIRRAMPYVTPHSLTADETYAVTAYLLALNGVIAQDAVMDASTLPKVVMPNRANFDSAYREPRRR